jgi:hypothetical protein
MILRRPIGDEVVLLDEVTSELCEPSPFVVAVKDRAEHEPEITEAVRRGATRSMLDGDVHHAAPEQAPEMEVGELGGANDGRDQLYGGLHFRIGHQRQLDQALDRSAIEGLPDRLVFGLGLFPGRVCGRSMPKSRRQVSAEATACAFSALTRWSRTFRWYAAARSTLDTARSRSSAVSSSAVSRLPVRNSHSARSSQRLNANSYWPLQSLSSRSAIPLAK